MDTRFVPFKPTAAPEAAPLKPCRSARPKRPVFAAAVLGIIVLGCIFCDFFSSPTPNYMDLSNPSVSPCAQFFFGTDTMGRDIFSMIWHGGRISLCIGVLSAFLSACIAVVVGAASACAPAKLDALLMRAVDILLSVPGLLIVLFLQAMLGSASVWSLSLVLGLTSWMSMAKVVRTEVKKLRESDYILAARCLGGGFFYILRRHLLPNCLPSILFMAVMNVRSAILTESTLSFMGMGLPLEIISWGSMLSLAEKALLTNAWWIIVIPGVFLIATLLCITSLGSALQMGSNRRHSNL